MLRLKATKTSLYKLVAEFVPNLPPMRSGTSFIKYPRTPDYALDWITQEWDTAHAFSPPAWAARSCPLRSRAEKPERR